MFKQTFCYHKVWHFVLSQGVFSMEKTPWKSAFTEKKLKMHFFFFLKSVCRKKCQNDTLTAPNEHS